MTVIAIFAILSAIAIPGFIGWRNKAQLSRAARDVYSSFQRAKSESVRRNERRRIKKFCCLAVIPYRVCQNFPLSPSWFRKHP